MMLTNKIGFCLFAAALTLNAAAAFSLSLGGKALRNHFLYGEPPFKWESVREWMKDTVLWRHD